MVRVMARGVRKSNGNKSMENMVYCSQKAQIILPIYVRELFNLCYSKSTNFFHRRGPFLSDNIDYWVLCQFTLGKVHRNSQKHLFHLLLLLHLRLPISAATRRSSSNSSSYLKSAPTHQASQISEAIYLWRMKYEQCMYSIFSLRGTRSQREGEEGLKEE